MTIFDQTQPVAPALPPARGAQPLPAKVRLGEELPIFCERCGYQLYGLPQVRCEQCAILQFQCPECGHHQPINTVRPAAQRLIGRLRAGWLALGIFFRINFFGWIFLAWYAAGGNLAFERNWGGMGMGMGPVYSPLQLTAALIFVCTILAFFFAAFGRMMLLRWRRGYLVGFVLGVMVLAAMAGGALFAQRAYEVAFTPFSTDFLLLMGWVFAGIFIGAVTAWPLWVAAANVFLPPHVAAALLDWQRSLPDKLSSLARDVRNPTGKCD